MGARFCPQCGHQMELREEAGREREVCPACGFVFYLNPVPGVAIIVEVAGGVLLVRRRYPPQEGGWCFPAGFVETGEGTEEAAARECAEETGLEVAIDNLVGVYSFSEDLDRGGIVTFYTAHVVSGALRAGDDAAEVRAFPLENMPRLAFRTHREALARWKRDRRRLLKAFPEDEIHLEPLPGLRIRRAHIRDRERVLALLSLIPGPPLDDEQLRAAAQRFQESAFLEVLVAEIDGEVVGFLSLLFPYGLTGVRALIDELAVEPAHRRQGIGASLVEAAVRLARRRGCSHLLVDTSRANEPAQAFYRACGFPTEGISPLRID